MPPPNLFSYATKELSQDAFICWLLDWANAENEKNDRAMYGAGCAFLNAILTKHGKASIEKPELKLHRQYAGADIVAAVNDQYVFLIEDKKSADVHGDQLERYKTVILREFPTLTVLPTYLKTGDQSNYRNVEAAGYKLFLRDDFLSVLRGCRNEVTSVIFHDFLSVLEAKEDAVNAYLSRALTDWIEDWDPWVGLYKYLQTQRSELEWTYVANQSGGFLGAWWHGDSWRECQVYLQIEQGLLCFKIEVEDESRQREMRDEWHRHVMGAAERLEYRCLRKPGHFGRGTWMTVAVVDPLDWLAQDAGGMLDLKATMNNISLAERALSEGVIF